MSMSRRQAVEFLLERPADFAHMIGFTKLNQMHNDWIREMIKGKEDHTLQSHRG